jgi:hypothetical protein
MAMLAPLPGGLFDVEQEGGFDSEIGRHRRPCIEHRFAAGRSNVSVTAQFPAHKGK